ncbi:DUF3618 domain-containing protein [Salsipaludibacter albus]|uniref:DUF3618 domain-containing protein n=1 Tax=Salsipaludibacter albus TaxID=2849650 RepID=UPI001EE49FAC|nr:DUF3618 domain-containing protein [Salsipaludibacter albus]MBY5161361.1 DUF3618 domain-containing protein [Salsipaludibacter albus]
MSNDTPDPSTIDPRLANEQAHLDEERRVRAAAQADDPERIREEIRMTRGRMDDTLGQLEDRVAPSRVAARGRARLRSNWRRLRGTVMGTVDDRTSHAAGSSRSPGDVASGAAHQARQAPDAARRATRGNPLAAGMVAFGLGALVAAALPESEQERRLVEDGVDRVDLQRLRNQVEDAVEEVREPVEAQAREGLDQVKDTASSEADGLRDEARSSQQRVTGEARGAGETARDRTGDP